LDACWVLAQRPDWESMAEWTPLTGWGGVQIGGAGRIGRQSVVGVASRFLVVADLDACWVSTWRPDWSYRADWTPVGCWRGIQIGDLEWTPLQYLTSVQSKLISSSGRLQSYKEAYTTFPLIGCEGLNPLFYAHKRGFCTEAPFATFQS